ncbi:MAG: thermonuclease family protein [Alphaproteobacteria bacterium]
MRAIGLARDLILAAAGVLLLILPIVLSSRAKGAEALPGPIPAKVTEIVDGDTVWVKARIWLRQEVATKVRLAGIDAPEIARPRAKCDGEIAKAKEARDFLASLIGVREVSLYEIGSDKYGDRIDARIVYRDGSREVDVGEQLLARGLAAAEGEARSWCPAT